MSFSPGASCSGASSSSSSACWSAPGESASSARSSRSVRILIRPSVASVLLEAGGPLMRILHTADWHVGKVLKGRSRGAEHSAVLGEIVDIARAEDVDVVIVAGDVFDAAAPIPAAQSLVMRT